MRELSNLENHIPFPGVYRPYYLWYTTFIIHGPLTFRCQQGLLKYFGREAVVTRIRDRLCTALGGPCVEYDGTDQTFNDWLDMLIDSEPKSFIEAYRDLGNTPVALIRWTREYNSLVQAELSKYCLTNDSIRELGVVLHGQRWGSLWLFDNNPNKRRPELHVISMTTDLHQVDTLVELLLDDKYLARYVSSIEVTGRHKSDVGFNCASVSDPKCIRNRRERQDILKADKKFRVRELSVRMWFNAERVYRCAGYFLILVAVIVVCFLIGLCFPDVDTKSWLVGAIASWLISSLLVEFAPKLFGEQFPPQFQG